MDQKQETVKCSYCKEEIIDEPLRKGGKLYCCEACAFEAGKAKCCNPDRINYSLEKTCQ